MREGTGAFRVGLVHCGNLNPADPGDRAEKNAFFLPMGIFGIAGALRDDGCEVEIIHGDLAEAGEGGDGILGLTAVDAVGFDLHWLNQSLAVLETAALVKGRHPGAFVFLGGFTASYHAAEILAGHPQVDAIVRGDAEVPVVRLCQALRGGGSLADVPNLSWRDAAGSVVHNEVAYVAGPADLEPLDFACLELLRHADLYRMRSIYWTHVAPANFAPLNFSPLFLLEVGRGCVNNCLFCGGSCTAQRLINHRQAPAWRSPASAFATIEKAVRQHGFRTIFTDFEFPGSEDWYLELFALVRDSGLELDFAYSSWGLTSPRLVDALSRTFRKAYVQFSPETADEQVRRRNKGHGASYGNAELEAALDAVTATPNVTAQLYFGYFLAGDTVAAVHATLGYVLRLLARHGEKLGIAYLPFSTDPASELQRDPRRHEVAMEPANFADYLACLRREYRDGPGHPPQPDLRLFRPLSLSAAEAQSLAGRIELLNLAFTIHRPTLSALLRRPDGADALLVPLLGLDRADPATAEMLVAQAVGPGGAAALRHEQEQHAQARAGFTAKPLMWLHGEPVDAAPPTPPPALAAAAEAAPPPPPPKPVERLFPFALRARILIVGSDVLARSRSRLHFILVAEDIAPGVRTQVLADFAPYPVVQRYAQAELEAFFGVKGAFVLGFAKSGLAQSIYAELKAYRINRPLPPRKGRPAA
jgi:radical SAM superfamily enzyme YgiQ (UPF0313 family)